MRLDPRQIELMLKSMGAKVENIKADKIIFESERPFSIIGSRVTKIIMQNETFYVISNGKIEIEPTEDEISIIMQNLNIDREKAKELFKKAEGDLSKAILMGGKDV
jgi:NACalpha-BTF3-like transcription factor